MVGTFFDPLWNDSFYNQNWSILAQKHLESREKMQDETILFPFKLAQS